MSLEQPQWSILFRLRACKAQKFGEKNTDGRFSIPKIFFYIFFCRRHPQNPISNRNVQSKKPAKTTTTTNTSNAQARLPRRFLDAVTMKRWEKTHNPQEGVCRCSSGANIAKQQHNDPEPTNTQNQGNFKSVGCLGSSKPERVMVAEMLVGCGLGVCVLSG
jgi:hypothetical protein